MGIAKVIMKTSGKITALKDSICCINKAVLLTEINNTDYITSAILSRIDGQILGI
jgi:hypothetical protein